MGSVLQLKYDSSRQRCLQCIIFGKMYCFQVFEKSFKLRRGQRCTENHNLFIFTNVGSPSIEYTCVVYLYWWLASGSNIYTFNIIIGSFC